VRQAAGESGRVSQAGKRGRTVQDRALKPLRNLGEAVPRLLVSIGLAFGLTVAAIVVVGVLLAAGRTFTELFEISGSAWPAIAAIPLGAGVLERFRRNAHAAEERHAPGRYWAHTGLWAAALAVLVISSFSGITTIRLTEGAAEVEPKLENADPADVAYEHYLWHLADSVPVLKVPETVTWEREHEIQDDLDGWLTLLAKILVILPLLEIARIGVSRLVPSRAQQGPQS
jgi:hypothetical protein